MSRLTAGLRRIGEAEDGQLALVGLPETRRIEAVTATVQVKVGQAPTEAGVIALAARTWHISRRPGA